MRSLPHYISASRRTDIPAFFADRFFAAWEQGEITYDGGYGRSYTVSLRPEDVLGYIFWSKNFAPFLAHPDFAGLIERSNALFHFTINDNPELEPRVPPLKQRIDTLKQLCDMVGSERVLWRYDPVCKWQSPPNASRINDRRFYRILDMLHPLGIRYCYFSFMSSYAKLKNRAVSFIPFTSEEKAHIAAGMLSSCRQAGLTLYNCCNEEIPDLVPGIHKAGCIDDAILRKTDRFGVHRPLKVKGTRRACGCYESRDIGSYADACPHGCLYCYANPQGCIRA
ncbi:MAG: DUF1848 family protein [Chitinivibrionales bacterium]|nr:DUF1848 family protein [Chitinivibrionales bacterium]